MAWQPERDRQGFSELEMKTRNQLFCRREQAMKILRILICLSAAFLLAACQAAPTPVPPTATPTPIPPTATKPASVGSTFSQTIYAGDGPYPVGNQILDIPEAEGGFKIRIYYPEQNSAPDVAHGPYPLIVSSGGLCSTGVVDGPADPATEHIVSYGFVVIDSDPRGETCTETGGEFWAGAAYRPLDVLRVIDFADQLTAPDGQLAGLIDTRRIGIVGYSSGGWTALMAGGAQMDLGWCAANPELAERDWFYNCVQFVPHQEEIASMLGLESAPAGLWPPVHDPRMAAVVALAPDGDIWGAEYEGVAVMQVPTLIIAGKDDNGNVPELCAYPIYEHLGSQDKALVMLQGAGHGLGGDAYRKENMHIITAFLLAKLKDDPQAIQALLPENMNFPGVEYETTFTGIK
jgi:predicted dienelactone hydrolase